VTVTAVALVGVGELACSIAEGLARAGLQEIRGYSRPRADAAAARSLELRAAGAGIVLYPSLEEALSGVGVVMATVPYSAAPEVARTSAPLLEAGCLYIDVAPLAPAEKQEVAALVAANGGSFVDAAVLGTVAADGWQVPIVAAGPGAAAWRELVAPGGMNVRVIDGPPGRAALVKLLRSVYMKGRDALVVETLVAARRWGLETEVIDSIRGPGERVCFRELAERVMRAVSVHAGRRADELEASAGVLREVGLEPTMASAGSERLRWVGQLGLREYFGLEKPEDLEQVFAAIEALSWTPSGRNALPVGR
jgi:3-hydroxyisobutyrate dehydrogenase-like beta-hydroxyacid dehydrogenase